MLQNVMTSEVLHGHLEATFITVDSVRFLGVKQKPSLVLVNSHGVPFTYRENQVSGRMENPTMVIVVTLWFSNLKLKRR